MPATATQPIHLIGHGMASTVSRPAACLRQWSDEDRPAWACRPVPGYPGVERPFGALAGGETVETALDRVIDEALKGAGLSPEAQRNAAVILGTSSLDIADDERLAASQVDNGSLLSDARWGRLLDQACRHHGLNGPQYTFNTACSSSANGLLYAQRMLSLDLVPAVVVIGFDGYTGLSFSGFHGLMLLAAGPYRPFDAEREGIVIAEGVAAAVLSRNDEGAEATVIGGHSGIDVSGITVASRDSLADVMAQAVDQAGGGDFAAIKAHGTGTPGNDSAESAAIHAVFGDNHPPFFSIKGGLGHTLGACGLVELLALVDCRDAGFLPASIGYRRADQELPIHPMTTALPFRGGRLLLNYFGFGGNNTSLAVAL